MPLPRPKRVPFHEPDPDRHAKSDGLRALLDRSEKRRLRSLEAYVEVEVARPKQSAGRRAIPDVPNPDESRCCAPEVAAIKAERGGRTLYFPSLPVAEQAFGGTAKSQRIKNATTLLPRQKDPYGWKWTRLVNLRNGGYRLAQP